MHGSKPSRRPRAGGRIPSKALLAVLGASLLLAAPARAHFIWIHLLAREGGAHAEVLFGDGIYQTSDANLVRYVDGLATWAEGERELAPVVHPWGLALDLPSEATLVGARKSMGLFEPPSGGPRRLLEYYAKGARDLDAASRPIGLGAELFAEDEEGTLVLRLLFGGTPAAGAELKVWTQGSALATTLTTDLEGRARIARPRSGALAARGRVVVDAAGELDGQSYGSVQYFTTLIVATVRSTALPVGADLNAYQLLEHATASLATAPVSERGLAGTLSVNLNGNLYRGEFEQVGTSFSLNMPDAPGAEAQWLEDRTKSLFLHPRTRPFEACDGRFPISSAARDGHPLGLRIELNDPSECVYRIGAGRILSSERNVGGERVVLQVQEEEETEDGRYLPRCFSVNYFDVDSGVLLRSESYRDDYDLRDGRYLPTARRVTSSEGDGTVAEIRFLTFVVF